MKRILALFSSATFLISSLLSPTLVHSAQDLDQPWATLKKFNKDINNSKTFDEFLDKNPTILSPEWKKYFLQQARKIPSAKVKSVYFEPNRLTLSSEGSIIHLKFPSLPREAVYINDIKVDFESFKTPQALWDHFRNFPGSKESGASGNYWLPNLLLPEAEAVAVVPILLATLFTVVVGYGMGRVTACVFVDKHLEACEAEKPTSAQKDLLQKIRGTQVMFNYVGAPSQCEDSKGNRTLPKLQRCMKEKFNVILEETHSNGGPAPETTH